MQDPSIGLKDCLKSTGSALESNKSYSDSTGKKKASIAINMTSKKCTLT